MYWCQVGVDLQTLMCPWWDQYRNWEQIEKYYRNLASLWHPIMWFCISQKIENKNLVHHHRHSEKQGHNPFGQWLVLLGWPKSLFGFFHKMLWKNPNKLYGRHSSAFVEELELHVDSRVSLAPFGKVPATPTVCCARCWVLHTEHSARLWAQKRCSGNAVDFKFYLNVRLQSCRLLERGTIFRTHQTWWRIPEHVAYSGEL